ncbi:MAG: GNAT family N-acetyltransferase [Cyanobacteria bacterium REEB67]|nr:GNAT family N-acetyltransferase [Cyanobacteria bacterium REEB67]
MIEIEFVESYEDIDAELWARCFPAPLEGLFWYKTLETCGLSDQFKFSYALIKRDKVAVGIAPCFLHDVPMSLVAPPALANLLEIGARLFPQIGFQRTYFVGSPCADEGTIGLLSDVALIDVVGPLAQAVCARAAKLKAPMVVFKDCPEGAEAALDTVTGAQKFFRIVSYPGTVIKLYGQSFADYLASMTRSHRYNFKKKLRKSKEILDLETSYVKRPDDAELAELFALFMQTYDRGKTKFERLSIEFFEKIRDTEPAWFILQRDRSNGRMLTFMLVFKLGDRLINKFIGLDYARAGKTFLYFRQFEAALNFAYSQHCLELQSGQTGYRAKLDLGHVMVPLTNYCRHANPLVNLIYARVARGINWSTLDDDLINYYNLHILGKAAAATDAKNDLKDEAD